MVDRDARNQVIQALRSYMADGTTNFEFDEALFAVRRKDETVRMIARDLWFFYDDMKEHRVHGSKAEWGYFNRALLLLESEAEIKRVRTRYHWCETHLVAAVSLVLFAVLALHYWNQPEILVLFPAFGVVSMVIGRYRSRQAEEPPKSAVALYPFPCFRSLRSVRRQLPTFARAVYRHEIGERRIRGNVAESMITAQRVFAWLMFSPLVLLYQALPGWEHETTVVVPA